MTDYISIDLGTNVGRRHHQNPFKKIYSFGKKSRKHKKWDIAKSMESMPLVADELAGSGSDDEINLDDVTCLRKRQKNNTTFVQKSGTRANPNGCKKSLSSSKSDPFLNCDFVELVLKEGDTLQSLSIRYSCSISDLKRANNLISNQEFYALRKIRIPVKKHGLLTELLKSSECNSTNNGDTSTVRIINIGIMPLSSRNSPEEAAEFLRKMDEDLVKIVQSTKSIKNSYEEEADALTKPRIRPLLKNPTNGSASGIQWPYLLIIILTICVILPIVIVVHMYHVKSSNFQPHNITDKHVNPPYVGLK